MEENWTNSEDKDDGDEALSFSDLPVTTATSGANGEEDEQGVELEEFNEFEFFRYEERMCVADEVFFQGQMVVPTMNNDSGSRSSSESSESVSRSQPSSTRSDSNGESARVCNFYYSHPSPKPYLPSKKYSLQPRRMTQPLPPPTVGSFRSGAARNGRGQKSEKGENVKNGQAVWRNRLGCQCCSTDVEAIEPRKKEKLQRQVFSSSVPRRSHGHRQSSTTIFRPLKYSV